MVIPDGSTSPRRETHVIQCIVSLILALVLITQTARAHGDTPENSSGLGLDGGPPSAANQGLAVLALSGATDPAWSLAQTLYRSRLRPLAVTEAQARVLAGEGAPDDAPPVLRDLAETSVAVRGDDAPSRALLRTIARELGVIGIVVVNRPTGSVASALLFLAQSNQFEPDPYTATSPHPGEPFAWSAAVDLMEKKLDPAPVGEAPDASATLAPVPPPPKSVPFFKSPWFWGALGGAVLAGGIILLVAQDKR